MYRFFFQRKGKRNTFIYLIEKSSKSVPLGPLGRGLDSPSSTKRNM